jgi:hypothetical protein
MCQMFHLTAMQVLALNFRDEFRSAARNAIARDAACVVDVQLKDQDQQKHKQKGHGNDEAQPQHAHDTCHKKIPTITQEILKLGLAKGLIGIANEDLNAVTAEGCSDVLVAFDTSNTTAIQPSRIGFGFWRKAFNKTGNKAGKQVIKRVESARKTSKDVWGTDTNQKSIIEDSRPMVALLGHNEDVNTDVIGRLYFLHVEMVS